MGPSSVAAWVDQQQSEGRYIFTKEDVLSVMDGDRKAVEKALRRLKEKGRVVRPRREFYVIVPLEYRTAGAPPPSWYIHDFMSFVGEPYYVGLLTAAGLYGAAHQRPQEFQVICGRPIRQRRVGRSRLRFFQKKTVETSTTLRRQTETGYMRISTPEQTALDLLRYVRQCGYLSNVATVLAELGSELDANDLTKVAAHEELANAQRLGYLLELLGHDAISDRLHSWLGNQEPSRVPLQKGGEREATRLNQRWNVYVNVEVEPDV